jgi:hypothetical protein
MGECCCPRTGVVTDQRGTVSHGWTRKDTDFLISFTESMFVRAKSAFGLIRVYAALALPTVC